MNGITVEAVRQRLLAEAATYKKKSEECTLDEALGRVLAETVTAPEAIPAFPKSPYDGFALPYEEGRQHFTVVATIGAGQVYDGVVRKGEAVRIMTGAPLPDGCDTIVMQERCELDGHALTVRGTITQGDNIIPRGEECEAGTILMQPGIPIGAGQLAVAAGVGRASLTVYRRPKVLLLTSGREIIAPGTAMTKGKVYNSNLYMLKGLLREHGLTPYATYHISDDPARLDEETTMVKELAAEADVIISTGGFLIRCRPSMKHWERKPCMDASKCDRAPLRTVALFAAMKVIPYFVWAYRAILRQHTTRFSFL
ncbi:molybdopterin molybdotransferase MoeA [uncultured Veillonella sp.]|uniref:molybdopterin molybdotransferase MoeA n=1 Tax=uncultured Veillonella sp. TaxID=159268 RepID=UPI002586422E|nr:molybdopterin molybdotransferase MoeA [uncultured Veillonella sp.]